MKKILLLVAILLGNVAITRAQDAVISLIGAGVGGWNPGDDIALETFDGVTYTIEDLEINGEVKFRQDNDWAVNWGGTFPSGAGVAGGTNIKVPQGVYTVTFNLTTFEYLFKSNEPLKPTVIIYGSAFGKGSGSLTSEDDTNFTIGAVLGEGEIKFESVVNEVKTVWGGSALEGTAVALAEGDAGIVVPAGKYQVSINITTGAYSFVASETVPFPSIGIIGTATPGGWDADTDMMTEDGVNYYIKEVVFVAGGELKFRQDNAWDIAWGGTAFVDGTPSDDNIIVLDGTYDIMLNRLTSVYSIIESSLGIGENSLSGSDFSVLVNPVSNGKLQLSVDTDVTVYDLSGRVVATSVDVSGLVAGSYIVKSSNGVAKQFIVK